MKNRAKCKLCNDVIESFHSTDLVGCKCEQIYVDGGAAMLCGAVNWNNFLRVDDNGNVIVVKVENQTPHLHPEQEEKEKRQLTTRKELLDSLEELVKNIDNLPHHAKYAPVNNADLSSVLTVILAILKN